MSLSVNAAIFARDAPLQDVVLTFAAEGAAQLLPSQIIAQLAALPKTHFSLAIPNVYEANYLLLPYMILPSNAQRTLEELEELSYEELESKVAEADKPRNTVRIASLFKAADPAKYQMLVCLTEPDSINERSVSQSPQPRSSMRGPKATAAPSSLRTTAQDSPEPNLPRQMRSSEGSLFRGTTPPPPVGDNENRTTSPWEETEPDADEMLANSLIDQSPQKQDKQSKDNARKRRHSSRLDKDKEPNYASRKRPKGSASAAPKDFDAVEAEAEASGFMIGSFADLEASEKARKARGQLGYDRPLDFWDLVELTKHAKRKFAIKALVVYVRVREGHPRDLNLIPTMSQFAEVFDLDLVKELNVVAWDGDPREPWKAKHTADFPPLSAIQPLLGELDLLVNCDWLRLEWLRSDKTPIELPETNIRGLIVNRTAIDAKDLGTLLENLPAQSVLICPLDTHLPIDQHCLDAFRQVSATLEELIIELDRPQNLEIFFSGMGVHLLNVFSSLRHLSINQLFPPAERADRFFQVLEMLENTTSTFRNSLEQVDLPALTSKVRGSNLSVLLEADHFPSLRAIKVDRYNSSNLQSKATWDKFKQAVQQSAPAHRNGAHLYVLPEQSDILMFDD